MKTYLRKAGVHRADLQVTMPSPGLDECKLQNCRLSLIFFASTGKEEPRNSLRMLLENSYLSIV